ncbi:type-F conjugative transfer system protein TraW [Klebsiella sp. PL-2018]|uniref:type-F conjugative transfer system protein TraW n=1 Tax=Klebsiella sp. PL-2018 TaxID=2851540 RepID=UPI001C210363|nr:type-F conjugative transfer system protein TraW [Klebsiella sp. PL-2018]QXD01287.1 IncF plasmid conjugative transfer pilus assembly protein TraW [Klebsiella sp. PL-2018]
MKRRRVWPGLLLSLLSLPAAAKPLGTWGDVYPIYEQNMLDFIHDRLAEMEKSGELKRLEEDTKKRVIASTLRPPPTTGLRTAKANKTWTFDPSITVENDIADHKGRVFAHKGQSVNPADTLPFPYALFFVDGDNAAQMAWVKKQDTGTKRKVVLLVNGNVNEAGKTLGQAVYFDQNGAFTKRFRVDEIPARVTLATGGRLLRVDVFDLRDEKP